MAEAPVSLGGTAIKPVGWDRSGWEAFQYFLYDPSTGAVLSRTPLSWLKITVFYLIYYTFLAAFWIACLVIFFQTLPLDMDGPRWTQDNGLIGNNPGVGLRPRNTDARIDSQMFVLEAGDENKNPSEKDGEGDLNADYAKRTQLFFEKYQKTPSGTYQAFSPAASLGACGTFPYGFVGAQVKPCIFFKLNAIWGWEPKPVECGDPAQMSPNDGEPLDECPESLLKHLETPEAKAAGLDSNIWIDCNGRNAADKEALEGAVKYFPTSRALSFSYFPYMGQKNDNGKIKNLGYHSPLVALQITPTNPGMLMHIECRAYFRGVVHDKKEKLGLVQFEVQINGEQ